jgi:hypothetical protein
MSDSSSNKALEPTPVDALGSAFAVDIINPVWLSLSLGDLRA